MDNDGLPTPSTGLPSKTNAPATPEKKMLKLRSDGRLRSPKSPRPTAETKSKRKRKSSESKPGQGAKIAIIKYGADAGSRLALAQKIKDIWEGKTQARMQNVKEISPPKPHVPAKPTHPFFLGKAAKFQEPGMALMDAKKSVQTSQVESAKVSSPNKASLPSKTSNQNAWSDVVGSFQKQSRHIGSLQALWPPNNMVHVLPFEVGLANNGQERSSLELAVRPRKLKDAVICVAEHESVLAPYQEAVKNTRFAHPTVNSPPIQKPVRKVMTGLQLQRATCQNVTTFRPDSTVLSDPSIDELSDSPPCTNPIPVIVHSGLQRMYQNIPSLNAFDKFECETQDWMSKYAPKRPADVLQKDQEIGLLRDWLRGLKISAVACGDPSAKKTAESSAVANNRISTIKKRRKKRAKALDGFVVSSDEEADQMDTIDDPTAPDSASLNRSSLKGSLVRAGGLEYKAENMNNAVVISGPHGCGKTAAVYAVTQELGFEVFEINAGSRRSGRDLLDKVGDMTRNHLVNGSHQIDHNELAEDAEDLMRLTDAFEQDIETGRQGKMQSFFKPDAKVKEQPKGRPRKRKGASSPKAGPKKPKAQKQSVILLEEVDVLFEEDKQFWTITLEMITRSKRPVIMTCTDERYLPLEDLPLFAVLRFTPPAESLATDYLLLLACSEGHLLSHDVVASLYRSKQYDLRASIAELNLFCQMAIGDTEGGLGWFLIRSSPEECQNKKGEALRVVSEGSYASGIGSLGYSRPMHANNSILERDIELLSKVWYEWGLDMADSEDFIDLHGFAHSPKSSTEARLDILRSLDSAYDSLSAADICTPLAMRQGSSSILDTTQPKLSEKTRASYIEGARLLEAEPLIDQTGTSTYIALTLRALVRRSFPGTKPLDPNTITQYLPHMLASLTTTALVSPQTLSTAFSPLKQSPIISVLASPSSTITTDIAPYIRSITAFDLRLEEQRRRLENAAGPSDGKRARTTRASRAALEGGAKATTRRERWFPVPLDLARVRDTGGKGWAEAVVGGE